MIDALKRTPLYFWYRNRQNARDARALLAVWEAGPKTGVPPHAVKQRLLLDLGQRHGLDIFVETGTLHGDMIEAVRRQFAKIYSIELSPHYAALARARFRRDPKVELIEGDSGERINDLLPRLERRALFWLDAHFSGSITARGPLDTPIVQELKAVLASQLDHVVVIDDAHEFGRAKDYPTIDEVRDLVTSMRPGARVTATTNAIVVEPA